MSCLLKATWFHQRHHACDSNYLFSLLISHGVLVKLCTYKNWSILSWLCMIRLFFKNWAILGAFFLYLIFSIQLIENIICQLLDLNRRFLVSEATAQPTKPQPLPNIRVFEYNRRRPASCTVRLHLTKCKWVSDLCSYTWKVRKYGFWTSLKTFFRRLKQGSLYFRTLEFFQLFPWFNYAGLCLPTPMLKFIQMGELLHHTLLYKKQTKNVLKSSIYELTI